MIADPSFPRWCSERHQQRTGARITVDDQTQDGTHELNCYRVGLWVPERTPTGLSSISRFLESPHPESSGLQTTDSPNHFACHYKNKLSSSSALSIFPLHLRLLLLSHLSLSIYDTEKYASQARRSLPREACGRSRFQIGYYQRVQRHLWGQMGPGAMG